MIDPPAVERAMHFDHAVLGLELLRREECRAGNVGWVSARLSPETSIAIRPVAAGARVPPHMDHACLGLGPTDMPRLQAALKAQGIQVEATVRPAWGAQGDGPPLKRCDPDGNKLELRCYREPQSA